jgi:cathepsin B
MQYKSGVYQHVTGSQLGGHAVMLIGYGHDEVSGLDYYLCQNSWKASWGDQGYFKIKVGDCGTNGQIYACPITKATASLESF